MFLQATIFEFPRPAEFKITDIGSFVGALGLVFFIVGALSFFLLLIFGGLQWLISGGDKAKTQAARDRITHALIGLSIIALSAAVLFLVQAFFGITIFGDINLPRAFPQQ